MRAIIIACLVLSGCTSMTPEQCKTANWREIGRIDGEHGQTESHVHAFRDSCDPGLIQPDLYEQGRQTGLKSYCTPAAGFRSGANGEAYQGVCAKTEHEQAFLDQFAAGQKVFALKLKHQRAKDDLAKERDSIDRDRSVVGDVSKVYHLLSGTSATAASEEKEERLSDEIYKRESQAPVGALALHSESDPAVAGVGVGGALVGTAFGFGLGHAIQGHYATDGWKWTAIDSTMIVGLVVVANSCMAETAAGEPQRNRCGLVAPLWFLGFLGARVWQSVELWKYAGQSMNPYRNAFNSKWAPKYLTAFPSAAHAVASTHMRPLRNATVINLGTGWEW